MIEYCIYKVWAIDSRRGKTFRVIEKIIDTAKTLDEASQKIDKLVANKVATIDELCVYPRYRV